MCRVQTFLAGCVAAALGCGLGAVGATAGQVIILPGAQNQASGDVFTPLATSALGNGGTTYLKAYSNQVNPPPAGTNASVITGLVTNGVAQTNPTARKLTGSSTGIPIPKRPRGYNFIGPPVYSLPNQRKSVIKANNDIEYIQSTTGGFVGQAVQGQDGNGKRYVSAFGLDQNPDEGAVGQAAGSAYDPFYLADNTAYAYAPVVSVDIESDFANLSAGVEIYALDSNTYSDNNPDTTDYPGAIDDFEDNDDNADPNAGTLWVLDISEDGVTTGPSALTVDFELDPSETEISFSGAELSSLGCTGANDNDTCIDDALDTEIENDLVSDGDGGEELSNVSLFANSVTYTPTGPADGMVEYGEGINAAVDDVPEPPTGGLFVISLLATGLLARRQRRHAKAVGR